MTPHVANILAGATAPVIGQLYDDAAARARTVSESKADRRKRLNREAAKRRREAKKISA